MNIHINSKKHMAFLLILVLFFAVGTFCGCFREGDKNEAYKPDDQQVNEQQKTTHQKSDKIYQNKKVVAEITGKVEIEGDYIFFEELSETADLKTNIPIEYQGDLYIITRMENYIKEYVGEDSEIRRDILRGVTCRRSEGRFR